MKGLFIPEITAEMFRNGCLESIEALMAEGEIYDIEYPLQRWIPVSEGLPETNKRVLVTDNCGEIHIVSLVKCEKPEMLVWLNDCDFYVDMDDVAAWMPIPESYKPE